MSRELAVIETVKVGMRDVGVPVLWFGVRTLTGGSLQVLSWKEADQFIRDWGCADIADLSGKPCVVELCGGTIRYIGPHK